jgi:hypothetical protein
LAFGALLGLAASLGARPCRAAQTGDSSIHLAPEPAPAPKTDGYEGPPLLLGGGHKPKVGGFAALGGAYTRFAGRDSGLVSFEAALLLDHRLSFGLVGYGFTRTPRGPAAADGTAQELKAGYGGLALRYSLINRSPVYGTFGLVMGAGAVNLNQQYGWENESNWDDPAVRDRRDFRAGQFDAFFFAQPEVALNTNLTRWLRLGANVGYRFTGGVSRFGLSESNLNGLVVGANLGFGWF